LKEPAFNARALMERAIEVMKRSTHEQRTDGKINPIVGAILYKPNGQIEEAFRCELREGDHAEYTLLERKNTSSSLDDCKLFATLEPCAPNSRSKHKLGCAERIVLARIKEVWVGIEDPDPTVDRKGIVFMERAGIKVHMFDRDLQDQIRELNKDFLEQAAQRIEPIRVLPTVLSRFESLMGNATWNDLDSQALSKFTMRAPSGSPLAGGPTPSDLVDLGFGGFEDGDVFRPTGFSLLLFGSKPRDKFFQAGLLGTIKRGARDSEIKDFDGPMVLIPEQVEDWLKSKLTVVADRSSAKRKDNLEFDYTPIREGIVNALVHRDYDIAGAKCQLVIDDEIVEIRSPGMPVSPIELSQLQTLRAPTLSRNPQLHYVFSRLDLAEERGLGMETFRSVQAQGLPTPTFSVNGPYLVLRLGLQSDALLSKVNEKVLESLNNSESEGLAFVLNKGNVSASEYARHLKVDDRTARRHLNKLYATGLLEKSGQGKLSRYIVKEPP
jgi:ATP-dependent DNA helicase RecG